MRTSSDAIDEVANSGKGMTDCIVYNGFCNAVNFANRCKFIGFTGTWTLTAEDNPHVNGTFTVTKSSVYLLYAGNFLTNCLVANNTAGRLFCSTPSLPLHFSNSAVWANVHAGRVKKAP